MFGNSFYNNQHRDIPDNNSKLGNIASLLSSKTVHIENMEDEQEQRRKRAARDR